MIKREARWKLLKIVLILYMVYAAVRMVFYGQGSLQSVIFDLGRIVLLVLLLWWLKTRSAPPGIISVQPVSGKK